MQNQLTIRRVGMQGLPPLIGEVKETLCRNRCDRRVHEYDAHGSADSARELMLCPPKFQPLARGTECRVLQAFGAPYLGLQDGNIRRGRRSCEVIGGRRAVCDGFLDESVNVAVVHPAGEIGERTLDGNRRVEPKQTVGVVHATKQRKDERIDRPQRGNLLAGLRDREIAILDGGCAASIVQPMDGYTGVRPPLQRLFYPVGMAVAYDKNHAATVAPGAGNSKEP